ncbi:MAG TPA: sulfatase [Terriglobales bacterium]|jgi:arylsulfatase A-like enzyme|nr:sulfatase [Terriglobales bacterium]
MSEPQDMTRGPHATRPSLGTLLLMAVWFGIVTGLVEGAGLLLFQRINWARWGPTLHVSEPIVWISAIVDVILFSALTLLIGLGGRLIPRLPAQSVAVFALSTATVYDWLALTARLYPVSCLLLALGTAAVFTRWFRHHESAIRRFFKRTVVWLVVVLVVAGAGIQGRIWLREQRALAALPPAAPGAPNVLLVVVDTLRADHLSSYGYSRTTSPNMDRLGRQGVLFENALSTTSWSFPSHVSLVTGRYQFEHGLGRIPPMTAFGPAPDLGGLPTLEEALERRGYRTGAFSANRLFFSGNLGFSRGFAHFEDYFHSPADMFVRTLYGREFSRIYLVRTDKSKPKRLLRWLGFDSLLDSDAEGWGGVAGALGVRKRASVVNQEVVHWLDHTPQRPFLAVLNYFDVHGPYGLPRSYPRPTWSQTSLVDLYDDGISYADDYLGQLLDALQQRGLLDNTLVVLTSDHGEGLWQHGLPTHGRALYRELIHVPLIFWYPRHIPSGIRVATPVTNAAIAETVMGVLGEDSPSLFPEPSLAKLWKNPGAPQLWPYPLSELAQNRFEDAQDRPADRHFPTSTTGPMKSLMTARWHLIVHKGLGDQLYDWVHDPGETKNLIHTAGGNTAAGALMVSMQDVLSGTDSAARLSLIRTAMPLSDTTATEPARDGAVRPGSRYRRLTVTGGDQVTINIRARRLEPPTRLDPVLAIEDEDGQLFQNCRNPGDDHIPPPGVPDSTPDAFDDLCLCDDADPGVNQDSRLEMLVPGASGSKVELYIRVSDWNGGGVGAYQINVTGVDKRLYTTAARP